MATGAGTVEPGLESDEELGVVSKVLGYSHIGSTADVYAPLTPAISQRVVDWLDDVLRRSAHGG